EPGSSSDGSVKETHIKRRRSWNEKILKRKTLVKKMRNRKENKISLILERRFPRSSNSRSISRRNSNQRGISRDSSPFNKGHLASVGPKTDLKHRKEFWVLTTQERFGCRSFRAPGSLLKSFTHTPYPPSHGIGRGVF